MLYVFLFFVRFLPFWAVPLALVSFEVGTYYYNRRERSPTLLFYGIALFLVILSIVWLVFEGYWRAPPFIKNIVEFK